MRTAGQDPGGALRGEAGSAVIEFVVLAVLLLVPLVYLVLLLGRLEAGAFAVQSAAASAARAAAGSTTDAQAASASRAAVDLALTDQGFETSAARTTTTCSTSPCLVPGGRIRVAVVLDVDLPLVPAVLAGAVPTTVAESASAAQQVERFTAAVPGPAASS